MIATASPARPVALASGRGRSVRIVAAPGVHPLDPYAGQFAAAMRVVPGERVLDLGCGAGGYAIAAAARGARVVVTDVNPAAVACALENAERNGLAGAVEGRQGSLFAPVRGERFDAIVTTLPQLPAPRPIIETRYGGRDGLRFLRRMAAEVGAYLAPGGRLYALVTDWADPRLVGPLLAANGLAPGEAARAERPFQPAEYDRYAPGLFAYLDARARRGLGRYRRGSGAWCYLGISLFEATISS